MNTVYEIYHHETKQKQAYAAKWDKNYPMFHSWDKTQPQVTAIHIYDNWTHSDYPLGVNIIQITVDKPFEIEQDRGCFWVKLLKPLTPEQQKIAVIANDYANIFAKVN